MNSNSSCLMRFVFASLLSLFVIDLRNKVGSIDWGSNGMSLTERVAILQEKLNGVDSVIPITICSNHKCLSELLASIKKRVITIEKRLGITPPAEIAVGVVPGCAEFWSVVNENRVSNLEARVRLICEK